MQVLTEDPEIQQTLFAESQGDFCHAWCSQFSKDLLQVDDLKQIPNQSDLNRITMLLRVVPRMYPKKC